MKWDLSDKSGTPVQLNVLELEAHETRIFNESYKYFESERVDIYVTKIQQFFL